MAWIKRALFVGAMAVVAVVVAGARGLWNQNPLVPPQADVPSSNGPSLTDGAAPREPEDPQRLDLKAHLARETGPGAVSCGEYEHPPGQGLLSAAETRATSDCIRSAHRSRKAFFFSVRSISIDSVISVGLLSTPGGEVKDFWFEEDWCNTLPCNRFKIFTCDPQPPVAERGFVVRDNNRAGYCEQSRDGNPR